MEKLGISTFLAFFTILLIISCASDDDLSPQSRLKTVGFLGTLPDGRTFGTEGIVTYNSRSTAANSAEGSFVYHLLSIEDTVRGITIRVELPRIKYSEEYGVPIDSVNGAEQIYNYPAVKEKLSIGEKVLLSSQNHDRTQAFGVLVLDQINYTGFTTSGTLDQTEGYLRVIDLVEGSETHPTLGSVKTLEVIFDVNVNLEPSDTNPNQAGKLEGTLRMKYREKQ